MPENNQVTFTQVIESGGGSVTLNAKGESTVIPSKTVVQTTVDRNGAIVASSYTVEEPKVENANASVVIKDQKIEGITSAQTSSSSEDSQKNFTSERSAPNTSEKSNLASSKKEQSFADFINSIGAHHANYFIVNIKANSQTLINAIKPISWTEFNQVSNTFIRDTTLPNYGFDVTDFRSVGPKYYIPTEQRFNEALTIAYVLDNKGILLNCFKNWQKLVYNYDKKLLSYRDDFSATIEIIIVKTGTGIKHDGSMYPKKQTNGLLKSESDDQVLAVYTLYGCYPNSMRLPQFDATSSTSTSNFDVEFHYKSFSIKEPNVKLNEYQKTTGINTKNNTNPQIVNPATDNPPSVTKTEPESKGFFETIADKSSEWAQKSKNFIASGIAFFRSNDDDDELEDD